MIFVYITNKFYHTDQIKKVLNTNQLIQAKSKGTITMPLSNFKLLVFLFAPDLILLELDRSRDKTENVATENRCAVRMGPRLTGHWQR